MIAIVAFAAFVSTLSPSSPPQRAQDEGAIRQIVQTYVAARDKGDEAAVRALFTDDADQLVSSGEWRRGREALVQGTLASSKNNAGTRTITLETIRFPTADVAIADGRYRISATATAAERNMWTSFVLVKAGGTWRISAIRNMLPAQ